jgi:anhydro-N-acetylmuramic acid kinase
VTVSGSSPRLFGGLMSGTSLDGVDAVLLEVEGDDPGDLRWEIRGFRTLPFRPDRRSRIRDALAASGPRELARLHTGLGEWLAHAFLLLLDQVGVEPGEVTALGSHGQTIWHEPPEEDRRGSTYQLGDPATLAERTGIPVVSDLRSRDVAAGGHGAPLVPWADWVLFRKDGVGRALQNLGGMGNVTFLSGSGGMEKVLAFDTGPGVALIDGAARWASGGSEPWDRDGRRAARGQILDDLLDDLLQDPFFRQEPPRSTGRERFGEARLREIVTRADPQDSPQWDDVLATLTALTAESVARSYRDFLPPQGVDEVVLTGGGARNPTLVGRLKEALDPLPVRLGKEALGMDPDAREAAAFALLAWAYLEGVPGNLPGVTGASGPRVLGSYTPGRARGAEGGRAGREGA